MNTSSSGSPSSSEGASDPIDFAKLEDQLTRTIGDEIQLIDACGQLCVDYDSIRRGVRKAIELAKGVK